MKKYQYYYIKWVNQAASYKFIINIDGCIEKITTNSIHFERINKYLKYIDFGLILILTK